MKRDYTAGRRLGVAAGLGVAAALAVACTSGGGVGGTPPSCSAPSRPANKPTTVVTIGQAYFCIFKH